MLKLFWTRLQRATGRKRQTPLLIVTIDSKMTDLNVETKTALVMAAGIATEIGSIVIALGNAPSVTKTRMMMTV
jgi:hypothetical protein